MSSFNQVPVAHRIQSSMKLQLRVNERSEHTVVPSLNFLIYSVAKNLCKIRVITSFYGESCENENEYSIQFGQELKTSLNFFFYFR